MPDPIRLAFLTELRESFGLTQAEAAERCGLRGRQSRKTLADWELGNTRPRLRSRPFVLNYLLRDLRLGEDPARFDDLYTILIDEWNWPPLEESERAELLQSVSESEPGLSGGDEGRGSGTAAGTPSLATGPADTTPADITLAGTEPADTDPADTSPVSPQPATEDAFGAGKWFRSQRIPAGAALIFIALGAAVVLSLAFFGGRGVRLLLQRDQALQLPAEGETILLLNRSLLNGGHANLGFEAEEPLYGWGIHYDPDCQVEVIEGSGTSQSGNRFLAFHRTNADCWSVYRDLFLDLPVGEKLTFGVYLRSADGTPRQGSVVIFAGPLDPEVKMFNDDYTAGRDFSLNDREWHCIETTLTIPPQEYKHLRPAVYLGGPVDQVLHLDAAVVQVGGGTVCPPSLPKVAHGAFTEPTDLDFWRWYATPCTTEFHEDRDYIAITRDDKACSGLFQILSGTPLSGVTYRAQVRARSTDGSPQKAILGLIAEGENPAGSYVGFVVGKEWQCAETLLTLPGPADQLRINLSFDEMVVGGQIDIDGFAVGVGNTPLCQDVFPPLKNAGFEEPGPLSDSQANAPDFWYVLHKCGWQIVQDPAAAHSGRQFLAMKRVADQCSSLLQDIPYIPTAGNTFRAGVWLRSPDGQPRWATLVLWAVRPNDVRASERVRFPVAGDGWVCREVLLTLPAVTDEQLIRIELYLETGDEVGYYIDDLQVTKGGDPLCPVADRELAHMEVSQPSAVAYPGSTVSIRVDLQNNGPADMDVDRLAYWLATLPQGAPRDNSLVEYLSVPAMSPEDPAIRLEADVLIPLSLDPGTYYAVAKLRDPEVVLDPNDSNDRLARPVQVLPCETAGVFCDIPADFWAFAEVETWFGLGITDGCRSRGTAPYENLPFCPDKRLRHDDLVVLFLRHLEGGGYEPQREYEGIFGDVPESWPHSRALWIEEFHRRGYRLPGDCPPSGDKPNFCPERNVTRGELLQFMASVFEWDLPTGFEERFSDVPAAAPYAPVVEYVAANDLLAAGDPNCPSLGTGPRFCPDDPARRAFAAVVMVRAFGER